MTVGVGGLTIAESGGTTTKVYKVRRFATAINTVLKVEFAGATSGSGATTYYKDSTNAIPFASGDKYGVIINDKTYLKGDGFNSDYGVATTTTTRILSLVTGFMTILQNANSFLSSVSATSVKCTCVVDIYGVSTSCLQYVSTTDLKTVEITFPVSSGVLQLPTTNMIALIDSLISDGITMGATGIKSGTIHFTPIVFEVLT